ncbi:hypothetical protein A9Q99_11055 [Gammaproteobacteria bacterium 45_16_T64]|nr:hypothetical protein A9Q99_11055 [Gammaproteobacteria bacterium 45_16_T64]
MNTSRQKSMVNRYLGFYSLFFIGLLSLPGQVFAYDFGARLDVAQWQLDPSPLECRLWQSVPHYGEVVFSVQSGGNLQFHLQSERAAHAKGNAELKVVAPSWRPGLRDKSLGTVALKKGNRPVVLKDKWANWFLDELQEGMNPAIVLGGWHKKQRIQVDVSAVNFQDAYIGYLSCVAGLFPANFEQLRTSMLNFKTDRWRVRGRLKERLDLVIRYIELDPEIDKVYIDGHTDNVGRRGHNWELSRLRSTAVQRYLEHNGVDPELITMRFHGESRPIVKNSTKGNKSKNRRVFVRLVKLEEWNQKT